MCLAAAEAPPALRVLPERLAEVTAVEVRPEPVDEDELCIGELPEHEVRDAELAARADQEVGIRELGGVQVRGEDVLVDLAGVDAAVGDTARRLDELGA